MPIGMYGKKSSGPKRRKAKPQPGPSKKKTWGGRYPRK